MHKLMLLVVCLPICFGSLAKSAFAMDILSVFPDFPVFPHPSLANFPISIHHCWLVFGHARDSVAKTFIILIKS